MAEIIDRIIDEVRQAPEKAETIAATKAGLSKTGRVHPSAAALLAGLMQGMGS